jgi:hypothetical protein
MKYYNHLLILLFSLIGLSTFAQTSKKTLNYQAVILDPKAIDIPGASIVGQPLNKGKVCLRFSLLNAQGGLDYEETQQVTTDEYGLVNVAIGTGSQTQASNSTSIYKSFESVVWNSSVKSLKVSVSYDGCSSFKQVSAQALNYTPYALYAEAVDYKNVRDAPTKLSQFNNDAGYLIPKDLDPLKSDIQTNSSKIEVANKSIADNKQASDATFLVVNQSISSLDTQVAQNTGSISNINTKITDQQNQILDNRNQITATNNNLNAQIGGLQGQLNTTNSTVNSLTGVAEVVSNKSIATNLGGANPSDQLYPSQKAAKSYIDNAIYDAVGSGVPDATTLAAGKVKLAGDLGGEAASPTVPALATKENTANKSTDVQADGNDNTKYPSVKAVKNYVDQAVNGTALAADLANKANLASPEFTGTPKAPNPASSDNSTQIATTAFVQAATAGIALQTAVDGKADRISPIFEGTPILPTGTTGVTQALGNNSTKLATTAYVDAQVAAGAPEASTTSKGIIQLTNALGGTASAPTVPGLSLKEDLENKSTAADLGDTSASDDKYPTQKAVKTYVDVQVASATIADADANKKGKIQLAGDLSGSAAAPEITTGAVTSAKILDATIATIDIADAAITTDKISSVSGAKVTGNISGNAENVNGTIAVGHGGTGATELTGYVKGNGTSAMSTVSSIPVADVAGAVRKVNGSLPNSSGEVSILFGRVESGNYAHVPTSGGVNGDIYIVSGDGNASNNGRTFIKDDISWNEVSPNTAATDARYLQLAGGIMDGPLSFPTGKTLTLTDAPSGSTDAVNKAYVDGKIATEVPNASTTVIGKIMLAGDLRGTYDAPTVPGLADKAPKENPTFSGTVNGITKGMVGLGNVDNTSDANKPVSDATINALGLKAPIASPSFTGTVSGITASMVGLGNVTNKSEQDLAISTATVTALNLKENLSNKKSAIDLGASLASHDYYPTQLAVKTYVDASVTSGAPDADGNTKGKIKLAGDLGGQADSPSIVTGAITSTKIADGTIVDGDISASAGIVDSKLATITTGGKVSNSATTATDANTASAIVARDASGNFSAGTITANLTGNAATATKLATSKTINGTDFDGSANITVTAAAGTLTGNTLNSTVVSSSLTSVGTLTNLNVTNTITGSVSGTATNVTGIVAIENGGTGATTFAAALTNLGAQSKANLSTNIANDATSETKYPAVKTIKEYVDGSVSSSAPNATTATKGKVQLAGDLGGTGSIAAAPVISDNAITTGKIKADAVTSAKIADGTIVNDDISATAGIADSKLATIETANKVSNSATTATDANTASAIVARDASGNFSAGTITAALTGNAATATKLAATKTINGTAFDGSSNITIVAEAGTLSGTTLNSTVVNSSLTSVGTLTDLTVTGDMTVNGLAVGKGIGNGITNAESTALGIGALSKSNNSGEKNTAVGFNSLIANTSGSSLTALGNSSLLKNTTGSNNVALGQAAMYNNMGGSNNVAIGNASLYTNISSFGNTAIGKSAGQYLTKENNTVIGAYSDVNEPSSITNATAIGYGARVKASNTIQLGADGSTLNTGVIQTVAITNVRTTGTLTLKDVTYPNVDGTNGQVLSTNGSGSISWVTPSTSATTFSGSLTGDVTGTQSATVVGKINGVSFKELSSGLLKNTTTTGIPSIASAGSDYSAGTSALGTGILKSTTTTGELSIASASDFPTLNQNTTGSAGSVTNSLTFNTTGGAAAGASFDGSAAKTIDYNTVGASPAAGSSSITTVGTITTGTWSGTAIGVSKGGTGLTSLSGNGAVYANANGDGLTSGTLPVASGGTGATTAANALTNLGASPAAGSSSITTVGTITTGTWSGTAISVSKGGTGATTAANALTNLGASPAAGSSSIATVGTITNGTWNGTAIGGTYGGTGVNNGSKTITLGGNLTTSGEFNTTLTSTALTSVTLPTTGTLATLAGTETLSNKTLSAVILGTPASGTLTNATGLPLSGITGSFTSGKAVYTNSTTTLTTGTLPTSGGGTGLTGFNSGGAVYASNTTTLTTGTLPVASGGTGSTTVTPNYIFAGPVSGSTAAAPSFRALVAADIPDASATSKGGVSTGIQTFAGNKTFTGAVTAKNYVAPTPSTTVATATTSIDFSSGNIFKITLGTNITTLTITNAAPGTFLLEIVQGGAYTVTFPNTWKWSGGTAPTITATNGKTDIITIVYDGTTYFASAVQNF